ncbi:MAG: TetR/AcrR family transcriptional regulator [Bacteroidales bacterium]|nr:TetR/AcrR family transcriptional regulator [Bacteroidales bacterium]
MQVLKADIEKRILVVSKKLFQEKGFRDTTTRDIAKAADITLSNLYHYFKSKDELFCTLVKPATLQLEKLLDEHHGVRGTDVMKMLDVKYTDATLEDYVAMVNKNKGLLKLLLFKAQGSSLENYKEYYVNRATRQVMEWFDVMKKKHPEINTNVSKFFVHLNNVWMFNLLEEALMHNLSDEEIRTVISEYIKFETIGWQNIIKDEDDC